MAGVHDATISIGELSDRTGTSVRSLRHYEQNDLLPAMRTSAGHRRFHPDATETVRRIRMFLDAGLPLAAVAAIMPCFTHQGARLHPCVTQYLRDHLDVVQGRIEKLDRQRDTAQRLQELVAQ